MLRLKLVTVGACLAATSFLPAARADEWNQQTKITINSPLAIPGKLLQPGTYVFKLLDSPVNRQVVEVYNADQTHLLATVITNATARTDPSDKAEFTFWETSSGQAAALKEWFYPGRQIGQQFAYPTQIEQEVAMNNARTAAQQPTEVAQSTAPAAPTPAEPTPPQAAPSQPETAAPGSSTADQSAPPMNESIPAESAANQSSMPPEPSNPAPSQNNQGSQSDQISSTSKKLPRTASPYPLIAALGLLSLTGATIVRTIRRAA